MRYFTVLFVFFSHMCLAQSDKHVEPFFSDLVSNIPSVRDLTMSSDGQEAYFSAQSLLNEVSVIVSVKKTKDEWSSAQIASFSGQPP